MQCGRVAVALSFELYPSGKATFFVTTILSQEKRPILELRCSLFK